MCRKGQSQLFVSQATNPLCMVALLLLTVVSDEQDWRETRDPRAWPRAQAIVGARLVYHLSVLCILLYSRSYSISSLNLLRQASSKAAAMRCHPLTKQNVMLRQEFFDVPVALREPPYPLATLSLSRYLGHNCAPLNKVCVNSLWWHSDLISKREQKLRVDCTLS